MCAIVIEMPSAAAIAIGGNSGNLDNVEAVIKKLVPKPVIPNLIDLARSAELKPLRHKGGIKDGY